MEICLQRGDNVAAWNVALSRIMEFIAVKCWLKVQQGCNYVILAPLHLHIIGDGRVLRSAAPLKNAQNTLCSLSVIANSSTASAYVHYRKEIGSNQLLTTS